MDVSKIVKGSVLKNTIDERYFIVNEIGLYLDTGTHHCIVFEISPYFVKEYRLYNSLSKLFVSPPSISPSYIAIEESNFDKYELVKQCCFADPVFLFKQVGTKLMAKHGGSVFLYGEDLVIKIVQAGDITFPYFIESLSTPNKVSWESIFTVHDIDWTFLLSPPVLEVQEVTTLNEDCPCSPEKRKPLFQQYATFSYWHCLSCGKEIKQ